MAEIETYAFKSTISWLHATKNITLLVCPDIEAETEKDPNAVQWKTMKNLPPEKLWLVSHLSKRYNLEGGSTGASC